MTLRNPGPGAYEWPSAIQSKLERAEALKAMVEASRRRRQLVLESIVEMTRPTLQGAKKQTRYTGRLDDRPGPQVYDPKYEVVRCKSQATLFPRAKRGQDSQEEEKPGPWTYNVNMLNPTTGKPDNGQSC